VSAKDGDGWIECECGNKHWGLFGAAGVALIDDQSILLQLRADWVHNGGTWGIPGGARDSHEEIIHAALREAHEEIGLEPSSVKPIHEYCDNHGKWSYTTVICQVAQGHSHVLETLIDPTFHNEEVAQMRWIRLDELKNYPLHPSFEKSLPDLLPLFTSLK
jgi:8-oxo-dGTP diphosphatase